MLVKGHKRAVSRWVSSGDLTYNIVTRVNAYYIIYFKVAKKLDLQGPSYKKEMIIMLGNVREVLTNTLWV